MDTPALINFDIEQNDYAIIHGKPDKVFIIATGAGGTVKGYLNKYWQIASDIKRRLDFTVIIATPTNDGADFLEKIFFILKTESKLAENYQAYFMGVSKGALIAGTFAHKFAQIKRMLLVNAPLMINPFDFFDGIKAFDGEKCVAVYGEKDPSFSYIKFLQEAILQKPNSAQTQILIVKNADHQFTGMIKEFLELPNLLEKGFL